ncbi:MAG: hypothetical protein ACTSU3_11500, partial [Candidatus Thorarchaeota archaeon]
TNNYELAEIGIDSPDNLSYENGSLGEIISWNATTENPKNFTISRDGETFDSGSWDGDLLEVNLGHLYTENLTHTLPITFTFECLVFNFDNETISDSVDVTVIADELAPIISAPDDFFYEVGSFDHEITWNITETNPDIYNITRYSNETSSNATEIEFDDWDGSNITLNVDGLNASHWYLFTLFVNDTIGLNSTSSVNITVYEDLSAPTITSPDDISYEFGNDGNEIIWTIYDSNPANYSLEVLIQFNDTAYGNLTAIHEVPSNITEHDWDLVNSDGDNITFVVDDIYLGNYSFTLTIFDLFGFNATDTVNVTIYRDVRAPIINATDTFTYEEGYTGYNLTWSAEENNPRFFNLTLDDVNLLNGTWRGENITTFIDGLVIVDGLSTDYSYNLTLTDFFNQTSNLVIIVTVTPDAHNPLISEVQVLQSYTTAVTNNITVQAYSWDLNNITSITIEWYMTNPESTEIEDMVLENNDFYLKKLGTFDHDVSITFRIVAIDNSSVNNIHTTQWIEYTVTAMRAENVPILVLGIVGILGILSSLVLITIYFKTKTK